MARKLMKKMVVTDEDGQHVEVPVGQTMDFSTPHADKDGKVPEFVNISRQIQQVCVPNNPDGTIVVPVYGILKGAQWRDKSVASNKRPWGDHPPFLERERNGNDEYDLKYLLSEGQMVHEINQLTNKKKIKKLIDCAIIDQPDDFDVDRKPAIFRSRDDRPKVADVAMKRIMDLDEREEKAKRDSE